MRFGMSLVLSALIGFVCTTPDPQLGFHCRGHLDKRVYSEEVALFVPARFAAASPTSGNEMIVHFHGHHTYREELKRIDTFDDVLDEFKFDEMLAASGRESILVVPSSQGTCETFREELSTAKRFRKFIATLGKLLVNAGITQTAEPTRLVLTGHSGAHAPISSLLASGLAEQVDEVLLFDALYVNHLPREARALAAFAARAPEKRFVAAYIDGSTTPGTRLVWSLLPAKLRGASFEGDVLDSDPLPGDLAVARPVFVRSDQEHWRTVNKYFPLFLRR